MNGTRLRGAGRLHWKAKSVDNRWEGDRDDGRLVVTIDQGDGKNGAASVALILWREGKVTVEMDKNGHVTRGGDFGPGAWPSYIVFALLQRHGVQGKHP